MGGDEGVVPQRNETTGSTKGSLGGGKGKEGRTGGGLINCEGLTLSMTCSREKYTLLHGAVPLSLSLHLFPVILWCRYLLAPTSSAH